MKLLVKRHLKEAPLESHLQDGQAQNEAQAKELTNQMAVLTAAVGRMTPALHKLGGMKAKLDQVLSLDLLFSVFLMLCLLE